MFIKMIKMCNYIAGNANLRQATEMCGLLTDNISQFRLKELVYLSP